MSRLGLKTVMVYHGDIYLGELEVVATKDRQNFQFTNREIRIHHLTPPSERCPPLSVLQTISSFSVLCKLESPSSPTMLTASISPATSSTLTAPSLVVEQSPLTSLHATCFHEAKTAAMIVGEEEIHLVAMPSKLKKFPCFWCFSSPIGLYESCLTMLNLRCLAIVFDLDETLIVANTLKTFEDKIETLRSWIAREPDPVRVSGMSAELKRLVDDRLLLKQYADNDYSVDANGKIVKVQMEEVPMVADSQEKLIRPVIRLPDRNIVLTRINPEIRDTSVLVRLRPAWEDLRSYLTARGRKRFEVNVCTMAERDYALEIWRLLDPEAHLISRKQLSNRLVCVKSGCRKSLSTVFQDGTCHPKMAMVIDDRAKVWEDRDQPRVHVVPPFTPYYAPQAETANAVPVLCVARNVACNVRGYFFKEFDEILIRKILEVFYEDDISTLPVTPDVSNYMMSEDAGFVPNGNGGTSINEGLGSVEVEKRFNQFDDKSVDSIMEVPFSSFPHTVVPPPPIPMPPKTNFHGIGAKRDFRSHTVNHPLNLSRGSSLLSPMPPFRSLQEADPLKAWVAPNQSSTLNKITSQTSQVKVEEAVPPHDPTKSILPPAAQHTEASVPNSAAMNESQGPESDVGRSNVASSNVSIDVLKEISRRCCLEIEYKSGVTQNRDLKFSAEVFFTGEKIGFGLGKTRKLAQQQAAENALHFLADKYVASCAPLSGSAGNQQYDHISLINENGFVCDTNDEE